MSRPSAEGCVLFPTVTFAVFFLAVMTVAWALRPYPTAWKLFLLGASWVFYAWWDARFVLLLAAMILANHLAASAMARWPRRARFAHAAGVAVDVAVLGFFKYYGFFVDALLDVLDPVGLAPSVPFLEIALVVGVSFYVFESIAYLTEVRRGIVARLPLLDLATYLSFFPKLTSGPITRASEFAPQLSAPNPAREIDASTAFWLLARGLVKKVVVASFLAEAITDGVFATPGTYSSLEVLFGIYAYTAQIYVDFSAYTDMAIGLGLLLGFRLPENFRSPYAATSVHDFWNRWHITLSRWVRDFLFQPLVVRSSRTRLATVRTLVVTMLLVGLWHGAAWTFVAWGGIHGVALALERVRREQRRIRRLGPRPDTLGRRVGARLVTFHVVALAWVFFRADSFGTAFAVLGRLGSFAAAPAVTPLLVAVLAGVFALQFVPADWSQRSLTFAARMHPAAQAAVLALVLLFVDALGPLDVPPFIYFRF